MMPRKTELFSLPINHRLFVFNYVNLIISGIDNFHAQTHFDQTIPNPHREIRSYLENYLQTWPVTFSNFPIGQNHISIIYSIITEVQKSSNSIHNRDPNFYFYQIGSHIPANQHRLMEMILKVNTSLDNALEDLAKFYNLINPNHYIVLSENEMRLISKYPTHDKDRSALYFELAWINLCLHRIFKLDYFSYQEIESKESYLGIQLSKQQLKLKSIRPEPNLKKILYRQASDTLKQLFGFDYLSIEDRALAVTVKFLIDNIQTNMATLPELSSHLGLTQRTLQRKLEKEEIQFSELVQFLRSEIAKQMLEVSLFKVTEIAQVLGYSESSAFNRAFKKWEGISPLKYRKQYLN